MTVYLTKQVLSYDDLSDSFQQLVETGGTGKPTVQRWITHHVAIAPLLYPERNGQGKRIVRQTKELSPITGATYYGLFFATDAFFSTDEEYGSLCFS